MRGRCRIARSKSAEAVAEVEIDCHDGVIPVVSLFGLCVPYFCEGICGNRVVAVTQTVDCQSRKTIYS
jgi:hypothetical protein